MQDLVTLSDDFDPAQLAWPPGCDVALVASAQAFRSRACVTQDEHRGSIGASGQGTLPGPLGSAMRG